jgi:hypothetical protein
MTGHDHERALELIMRGGTEDLAGRDVAWLDTHLAACSQCAAYAEDFDSAGQMLRAFSVTATSSLVSRTQERVRARALYLEEQRSRMVLIAISFCLGVLSSVTSAWLWWRFSGWLADKFGLTTAIVEPGILLLLLLPAVVIAVLMLALPSPMLEERFLGALGREREGGTQ